MRHLGDITKLHGDQIPVVDIITGGSPCQDLSVAGKRAGLDGERSGLFMEQIRIVKEMRERDRRNGRSDWLIRPRFMVWENVPGAFSSNKGRDFQAVLSEIVKIAEPDAPDVPLPEGGRWSKAGCLYSEMGDWSIAWRVHDAQFWGVPQRRKRIALVADFGGLAAPEILFERKGLRGNFEPCGEAREGAATGAESVVGSAIGFTNRGFESGEITETLRSDPHGAYPMVAGARMSAGFGETGVGYWQNGIQTLRAEGENRPSRPSNVVVQEPIPIHDQATRFKGKHGDKADGRSPGDPIPTLSSGDHHAVYAAGFKVGNSAKAHGIGYQEECSPTIQGGEGSNQKPVVLASRGKQTNVARTYQEVTGTLNPGGHPGSYNGQDAYNDMLVAHSLKAKANCDFREDSETYPITNQNVRRLTPLECERLQGYPDGWTDIGEWTDTKEKKHKEADSPRYKALGNSIALPFWAWMARRICSQYERTPKMGSLFDGIGGFPLVFQRSGAVPVWASEIEEFPIAVTKRHFPENAGDS